MKKIISYSTLLLLLPLITSAADPSLQSFFRNLLIFFDEKVIPFLLGIAFLILVFNVIRYFVVGGANQEDQERAKSFALYSVLGLVLIIILWGLVNMLVDSIGLGGVTQPIPDYIEKSQGLEGPITDDPCEINPSSPLCVTATGAV